MTATQHPLLHRTNRSTPSLEALEDRRLFAVSLGSDGWTDITPSSDTRIVYVSNSSGSDANGGLSSSAPVKTIAKARSLLRSGSPDWMVLKRGDAWTENLADWKLSGRSQQEPMVIGAYGSGSRPTLNTGTSVGFKNSGSVAHLAIMGIKFHAQTRDTDASSYSGTTAGDYGFHTMGLLDDVLVEDSVFDDYVYNLSVTGYDATVHDFRMRRSIVTDAWSPDGKSQGMYVHKTSGLVLEENVFDHNGWNTDVAGAGATIYSHGIYMSASNDNVTVRGNIIADSASHGLQARSGGIIENNVFLHNPINLTFGGGSSVKAGGVSGRVTGNVILDSRDISGSKRGMAMEFSNIKAGANVVASDNIMAGDTQRNMPAITFNTNSDASNIADAVGVNDLTIRQNIVYDWYSGVSLTDQFKLGGTGNNAVNNLKVQDNDFQNTSIARLMKYGTGVNNSEVGFASNRYNDSFSSSGWFQIGSTTSSYDKWKSTVESTAQNAKGSYADPTRSVASYMTSIGKSGGLSGFLGAARNQALGAFDSRYTAAAITNYIRSGFSEGGVIPGGLETVPSSSSTIDPIPTPSGGGSTSSSTGDTSAPTAPTNFHAVGASTSTVSLYWDASSDNVAVTGYEIFRDGVKIATVTGTAFTDTGRVAGTTYQYKVRAFDAAGNLSAFISDPGTTYSASLPSAPTSLVATKGTNRTVKLAWIDKSSIEGGFYVYTSTNGSTWTKLTTVAAKSGSGSTVTYTTASFASGTRYFRVSAYNSAGESAPTSSVKVTL